MPAEIPDGAVIVARAIMNSSLWTMRAEDCKVAITCLVLANWKDRKWFDGQKEIMIRRGQFVRSREDFAKACGLSLQRTRTSVKHLENTGFLTRFSTKYYTVFTIPKYQHYQDLTKYSDSVMSKSNPVSNPRLTRGQPVPNHKQEGKEWKEGEEGEGEAPRQAPPAEEPEREGAKVDEVVETVNAFRAWKMPGMDQKRRAIEDLLRQGVTHKRLRAAAEQNGTADFFAIFDRLKNGKAEMPFVPAAGSPESRTPPPVDDGRDEKLKSIDDRLRDLPAEILKIWTDEASVSLSKLGRTAFGPGAQIYIKSELRKRMATEMGFTVDKNFP
jgi:hypothetical protein